MMNKKINVVVVHGSNDSEKGSFEGGRENTRHWHPWLKKELELNHDISCSTDLYPCDWKPVYEDYREIFEKNELNENTILVGHSAGCAFIFKYLNNNPDKIFKRIILVAPYVFGLPEYSQFEDVTISYLNNTIKNTFHELIVFYSENDSDYIIDDAKKINNILGGKLLKFENKGHFIINKFPELLEQIISE